MIGSTQSYTLASTFDTGSDEIIELPTQFTIEYTSSCSDTIINEVSEVPAQIVVSVLDTSISKFSEFTDSKSLEGYQCGQIEVEFQPSLSFLSLTWIDGTQ